MAKANILYQSNEKIIGKHLHSKQYLLYLGVLTIYDSANNSVVLKLKSDVYDTFLSMVLDKKKEIKGNSVSEVYGKLAQWFNKNGVRFQN